MSSATPRCDRRMILSIALGLQLRHPAGQIGDRLAEAHGRPGRGDLHRLGRGRAEDAHLLAADLEHQMVLGERRQQVVARDVDVARQHRELRRLDELRQRLRPEVELVVAVDHRVRRHPVQELGLDLPLPGGEEQRALEHVAGDQHQRVAAAALDLLASGVDRRLQPRRAAEAVARRLVLGRAGRLEGVDRLDAAVEVVEVQHVEREGSGWRRQQRDCGCGEDKRARRHRRGTPLMG